MESVGQLLRTEREAQGKTIEDVAKVTKMSAQILEALEEDRFSALPAPVYVKGQLRTYARHLGLDEDEIVQKYMRFTQQSEPAELDEWDAVELELAQERQTANRRWLWTSVAAAVVIILVVVLSRWERKAPPGPAEEVPLATEQMEHAPWVDTTKIQVHPLELMAVARERVYVRVAVDGTPVSDLTLEANDRRRWEAAEKFSLFVGTGDALDLYLNGEYLGRAGAGRGPVDNLVITEAGMSH
jgi:transcriptional regulator with XRE-family HTH domain